MHRFCNYTPVNWNFHEFERQRILRMGFVEVQIIKQSNLWGYMLTCYDRTSNLGVCNFVCSHHYFCQIVFILKVLYH